MSKNLLSEGLFDKLINLLTKDKINKGVEQLKKDPALKKSINNFVKSKEALKQDLSAYEEKYGETAFSKKAKDLSKKQFGA